MDDGNVFSFPIFGGRKEGRKSIKQTLHASSYSSSSSFWCLNLGGSFVYLVLAPPPFERAYIFSSAKMKLPFVLSLGEVSPMPNYNERIFIHSLPFISWGRSPWCRIITREFSYIVFSFYLLGKESLILHYNERIFVHFFLLANRNLKIEA